MSADVDVNGLLERARSTNVFVLPKGFMVEMTKPEERALIAMLGPAADRVPAHGRLSTMPNFMPRGNIYNRTECEVFQEPGWLLSHRRSAGALPVFRELFANHASREVRLASGHFLLAYPDTGEEVAAGSVLLAKDLVGWFRLWIGAQIALSPADAYVAVADRIASAEDPKPLLMAVVDAGWMTKITDPRWGELAMMALEHHPRHHAAISVLANLKDRRVLPILLAEIEHPDYNTSRIGMEKLGQLVGDETELVELVTPVVEKSIDTQTFRLFFRDRNITAGLELVARIEATRPPRPRDDFYDDAGE